MSALVATQALAQSPSVSLDGSLGVGHVSGGRFFGRNIPRLGAAMHVVVPRERNSLIAGIVGEVSGFAHGDKCLLLSPGERCVPSFRTLAGLTAEGGIRHATRWAAIDVTAGAGAFNVDRANGLGLTAGLALATTGLKHVGFVASARGVALPNISAEPLWYFPVSIGVRLR